MDTRKGFTLIELLVVIAIIAVLMAILMPALQRVKKQAKNAICQAHLKGLGVGLTMYRDDNDGRFYMPKGGIWVRSVSTMHETATGRILHLLNTRVEPTLLLAILGTTPHVVRPA